VQDAVPDPLLDVLQRRFPDSSKTTLRKMLQSDRVRVNGTVERDAKRVIADDDRVDVASRSATLDPRVRILFEDDDLIVVHKAEGLNTVAPGENVEAILNTYRPVHVVHRLDRDTSGVLVFAKNAFIHEQLQELFAAHDIERVYIAIVHGKLEPRSGTFRSFLAEDRDLKVRSADAGKEAITHYRTIAADRQYSMLELTLETGRRNQIRVHLAEAGHPVVGDTMYGRRDGFTRLALHAKTLGFVHPRTKQKVTFEAEVPKEFRL
jgi:tRNA pseudouridine32 synthase/23S rRNA pseudouridine746 synthase/23S rRNA pseudouridine1911/1915/1917 synthase